MFSVWTLSSLMLSCSLAFPICTNSSSGSHRKGFSNDTEENFTVYKTNVTSIGSYTEDFSNATGMTFTIYKFNGTRLRPPMLRGCVLASCALDNLVNDMQTGDESAGGSTHDPWGPGKK